MVKVELTRIQIDVILELINKDLGFLNKCDMMDNITAKDLLKSFHILWNARDNAKHNDDRLLHAEGALEYEKE